MTTAQTEETPQGVTEVLAELDDLAAAQPQVCVGDVLDDFGARSFGPFIMLPALLESTPIGWLPGMPSFLALIVAITAVQLFLGRDHVWMPQFIQRRAVSGRRLHKAVIKLRGIAKWLDGHSHGRLQVLTQGLAIKAVAVVIIALCLTVPPLEFVPFASSAPLLVIAVLGLALTVRDGVLMLMALSLAAAATGLGGYLLVTGGIG